MDYVERLEALVTKTGMADLSKLSRQKIESPHISQACEALINKFGGLEGFTRFYYGQVMQAAETDPGSRTVLEACKTILNLISASTEHRKSAPDVVDLSDDDLEREKAKLILGLVVKDTSGEALEIIRKIAMGKSIDNGDDRGTSQGHDAPPPDHGGGGSETERPAEAVRADTPAEGSAGLEG